MSDEGIEYLFPMTSICPPWTEAHEDERGVKHDNRDKPRTVDLFVLR